MKTEQEIEKEIEKTIENYGHVLDCGPATVQINSPRALMQLVATSKLDTLHWLINKKRPRFTCDDNSKLDH